MQSGTKTRSMAPMPARLLQGGRPPATAWNDSGASSGTPIQAPPASCPAGQHQGKLYDFGALAGPAPDVAPAHANAALCHPPCDAAWRPEAAAVNVQAMALSRHHSLTPSSRRACVCSRARRAGTPALSPSGAIRGGFIEICLPAAGRLALGALMRVFLAGYDEHSRIGKPASVRACGPLHGMSNRTTGPLPNTARRGMVWRTQTAPGTACQSRSSNCTDICHAPKFVICGGMQWRSGQTDEIASCQPLYGIFVRQEGVRGTEPESLRI